MQLREKCLCLTAVLLVLVVSVASARPYDEQQQQQAEEQNGNVRDKRTLNFLLKSFADAIGYDVQKRPSTLPFGVQLAPVGLVPVIPPIGPVTAVKAPAMAPASPAAPAMAPVPAVMAPAAPAMAPAPAVMAPAPPAMIPAKPAVAPAPAAMAPAPAGMAPAAGKAPPVAPAMAPASGMPPPPSAAPAMPPAAPAAPAMAPASGMPPAAPAAPAMAPASGMPPVAPAAPAGKAAPLLTETIRKVFNLNFNWNRNLQPQRTGVASAASAPQMPAAGAPATAPQMPAGAPASQMPAAGAPAAPASQMPAGAVPAVAAPAPAPQMPAAPAVPNIVPLAVPAAKDPMPAPMAPAMVPPPDMTPVVAPAPSAPKAAPAPPAASTPSSAAVPAPAGPAPLYYQPNVQFQPNPYQDLQNINQPQLYYPTEQTVLNEATSSENLQKDYSLPEAVQLFWQHSPWNRPHLPHVQNAVPEYRQYSTPDGERGYHVQRVQQNAHLQHHDHQPQDNDAEEEDNNARERQEAERSSEENDDANGDSSKAFVTINNQPRGFQPAYAESRNQFQNGGFYQPGLPLAVHGVHEDKVLVAWPSPFELAGSEKKLKKINPNGRISGAASENLEYRYQPENYDQFNFYTIPPPTKNAYDNYETVSDPNLADTLSANARIHENSFGKKYTTVHIDRQTYHH